MRDFVVERVDGRVLQDMQDVDSLLSVLFQLAKKQVLEFGVSFDYSTLFWLLWVSVRGSLCREGGKEKKVENGRKRVSNGMVYIPITHTYTFTKWGYVNRAKSGKKTIEEETGL
jgi:hypothetical protein